MANLDLKNVVSVSAEHGHGVEKLSSLLLSLLPDPPPLPDESEEPRTRIAFMGRPNVGKSSLCNRLLNMERLIVSDVPGTTRETVELDLDYNTGEENELWKFRLFDTAGLKRGNELIHPSITFLRFAPNMRSRKLTSSFFVLDAREGVTKQDKILAGHVLEEGRALAILVNKWDLALESFRKDPLPGYENEKDFRKVI